MAAPSPAKSGHNSDRSRTSNKGPDAGPAGAGAEIRYIPINDTINTINDYQSRLKKLIVLQP